MSEIESFRFFKKCKCLKKHFRIRRIASKILRLVVCTTLVSTSAFATASRNVGKLTIDKVWEEGLGDYRFAYVLVTWENTTNRAYRAVTIQAIAHDSSENKLNIGERSFFEHREGPIEPGFKGTLKIPIQLKNEEFKSASASVTSAVI